MPRCVNSWGGLVNGSLRQLGEHASLTRRSLFDQGAYLRPKREDERLSMPFRTHFAENLADDVNQFILVIVTVLGQKILHVVLNEHNIYDVFERLTFGVLL